MYDCSYYESLESKDVLCKLCPHNCIVSLNKTGICKSRININGTLKSLNYSKITSIGLDPIEKKPLYHFHPGEKTLSLGSFGCNFRCLHCQNYLISNSEFSTYDTYEIFPDYVIELAKDKNTKIISYTYNEPTVFYEFVLETAILAKKNGFKNVLVSNGFINKAPLEKLSSYIDAANIDLKSFSESFYKSVCFGKLSPVLETMKFLVEKNIHLEISYLIIPGLNDSLEEIKNASEWILKNLGKEIPIHFNRFFPMYKMKDKEQTPIETLLHAKKIATEVGLINVYVGNVEEKNLEINKAIICSKCKKIFSSKKSLDNICSCGNKIYGVF